MIKTKKKKSLPKLLEEAQRIFNRWVRTRDSEDLCISCGCHHEDYDAGHYVPQKGGSFLRFHEWNCNKEGKSCNGFDKFHLVGYRKRLIEKIGLENVEWLESKRHEVKKWTREELEEIKSKYKT